MADGLCNTRGKSSLILFADDDIKRALDDSNLRLLLRDPEMGTFYHPLSSYPVSVCHRCLFQRRYYVATKTKFGEKLKLGNQTHVMNDLLVLSLNTQLLVFQILLWSKCGHLKF